MDKWGNYVTQVNPSKYDFHFLPFLDSLSKIVDSVNSSWKNIVGTFSSSYSKELQSMETDRGFDSFRANMKTFLGRGIPHNKVEEFLGDLSLLIEIPDNYRKYFNFMSKWVMYSDADVWVQSDITFSKSNGGKANNFNFFSQNLPDEEKINVVYITCDQEFELAPDTYVWVTRESNLGGLFSKTKTEIETKPTTITESQLKFVSEWFLLLAYQELARFLSITCPGECENPIKPNLENNLRTIVNIK